MEMVTSHNIWADGREAEIRAALNKYQAEISRLNTVIETKPSAKMMNALSQKIRELTDENESLKEKVLNMNSMWNTRTQVMNDLIAELKLEKL